MIAGIALAVKTLKPEVQVIVSLDYQKSKLENLLRASNQKHALHSKMHLKALITQSMRNQALLTVTLKVKFTFI